MERISKVRAMVFLSIFLLVFVLYAAKLFDLQIIETKGDTNNMTTYTSLTRVKAARGDILDRTATFWWATEPAMTWCSTTTLSSPPTVSTITCTAWC